MGTSRGEALGHPVFVVRLDDESMLPRYRRGALLCIDPSRTPTIGDEVYAETSGRAAVGILLSRSAGQICVKPYNAAARRLPAATRLGRVVPAEEFLL